MEENLKLSKKISLSIWVTQLVLLFAPFLFGVLMFLGYSFNASYMSSDFDSFDAVNFILSESIGMTIIMVSGSFALLMLSIWLFITIKHLTDGKVKKFTFITSIIYFVIIGYNLVVGMTSLFVDLPISVEMLSAFIWGVAIVAGIMMIISWYYLKDFDRHNAPSDTEIVVPQPQWNQPYPQMPFVQPQIHLQVNTPSNDPLSRIEHASELKEKGLLTEEEFQKIKDEVLSGYK